MPKFGIGYYGIGDLGSDRREPRGSSLELVLFIWVVVMMVLDGGGMKLLLLGAAAAGTRG